jgi:ribosomal protein S18 acetylase RimI-like enzyme
MYDVVLFCNDTHWFNFEYDGYGKSKARLEQSLKGYLKYCSLSKEEIAAFYDMIAVYHFQLQATMMEIHGYDCVDTNYFDKQYDWLMKWKEQCKAMSKLRSKSDIVGFAWRTRQVNMIDFREMQEKDIAFLSELLNEGQIIASLHNAVMSYEEWLDTYRKYWKDDDDEKHFIIHEDENPVGWIKLNGLKNPGTAWISMLAVSTKQQKKGIGYRAVTFAEEYVKSRGFAKIGIHTTEDNLIAQKLYKKCGYSIIEYGACTTGDGVQRMGYTFMKNLDCIE